MSNQQCPCGSLLYSECCQPLHLAVAQATTAEQLMRSRYSAFALQNIDYILRTTALGQQQALDRDAIAEWSKANQWLKLEIVQHIEKINKNHAQVEFKAHYHDGQKVQIHHEVSHFVYHQTQWFFLDPTTEMQISMKQPCICGSGRKFKLCCAEFI